MVNHFILSGAGPTLTQSQNWSSVLSATPRTTISTTTTARKNLRSGARSVATCFRLTRDSVKMISQNTSALTATTLSFDGKSEKRSQSTNAVLMTAGIASRRLRSSIPMNGYYRRNEARSSNSAISTGSIITNPRSFYIRSPKSRSSNLRRSITPRTSSVLSWPFTSPSLFRPGKPRLF